RMLVRWVAREIVADHPYSYNPLYARRTLSLGAEAIPALLAASGSAHALLRENAIGLLAAFSEPRLEVVKALHEALADPDAVARNRALEGLIRWGHKDTEKALIQSLKSNRDPYFTAYAVQALGRMGSVEARTPLLRLLKGDHRDKGDLWHTAVQALGRIPDPKGETRRALKTFQRFCAGRPEAFDQLPGMAPDAPDRPGDRARLLVDAATIAGARLGDDASKKRLLKILKEGSGAPQDGGGGVFRRQTVDPVLGAIEPSNQIQAIEALAALSEDDQLERIVRESRDFILRGYALDQVLRGGRRVDFVRKVAEDAALPSVLRVQAMEALALGEATREGAIAVAKSMVRGYLEKRDAAGPRRARRPDLDQDAIPSYECLAAIKLLGRHGALEAAALVDVVRRAREAGDYERLEGPEAPEDEERGRGRNVPAPGQVTRTTLKAFPALFETAVVELGRAATDPALAELLKVLQERGGPGRAEAALALGNFRRLAAADALLQALEDPEPWVRYAAYRSLRKLSGAEGFADWLFGSPAERAAAVKAWREWRAAKGQELPG
ncbi:MAG: HEAT repeat domain-containing protein, partial [Planctomycetes bacterium]|nr:HEAT repeat domain-containing protein [Planctomycetota bacterium]